MRIPSQFNEDNLYRRGHRRGEAMKYQRRLLRLFIALGIVLIVMRQASKPAIYQPFLQAGTFSPADAGPSGSIDASRIAFGSGESDVAIAPRDRDIANQLVDFMSATDQRQWVVALSRWQSARPVQSIPSSVKSTASKLKSVVPNDDDRAMAWQNLFESFEQLPLPDRPSSEVRPVVAAMLSSLDNALAARVVDGSVWRTGDFDMFYRYLDQAEGVPNDGVVATGVLPLLQQPKVFRNQLLRFQGQVARAERLEASDNPFEIESYWQLWLRPAEGADRPLVAIVRTVPPEVRQLANQSTDQEGPGVVIAGRFLKRLAYESSLGADLAPVLVGRILATPAALSAPAASGATTQSTTRGFWLIALGASAIGFGLAVVAMWRTSLMAKRTRALRRAHREGTDDFLEGLRERAKTEGRGESE